MTRAINAPSTTETHAAPVGSIARAGRVEDPIGILSLGMTFAADIVEAAGDGGFKIRAGGRILDATPAVSCLVEPCPGDGVLCCMLDQGSRPECFVLSVLTRRTGGPVCLRVAGDLQVRTPNGSIDLMASETVCVKSQAFTVETREFQLHADEASLVTRALTMVAETCAKTFNRLTMVGGQLSTVFTRELHHAQSHMRTVDGVDKLSAQVVDHEATQVMQLRGENVLANGARLIKMQGSQIHLG